MVTVESLNQKIQVLIDKANSTTGKSDTTLNDGVNSLIAGFGQEEEAHFTDILRLPGTVIHYGYVRNSSGLVTRAGCITVDFDLNEVMGDYTKQQTFRLRWINASALSSYGNIWTSNDRETWVAMGYISNASGLFIDDDSYYTAEVSNVGDHNRRYVTLSLQIGYGLEINENNVHICILTLNEKIGRPQVATQFTNLFDLPTTEVHRNYYFSGAFTAATHSAAIRIKISPTGDCVIRLRTVLSLCSAVPYVYACSTIDGSYSARCGWYQAFSYDEYGDIVLNLNSWVKNQGYEYLILNFRIDATQYANIDDFGIMTLNEPIGNGGYVE